MGPMSISPVGGTKVTLSTTTDHPNFTGSNPNFDAINGPWDVDNDGDGVPDSVWIDAGYPAQMRSDGKLYKPLVAILCVDLDGRLNVNAAGTTEQLTRTDPATGQPQTIADQFAGTNGVTKINLPRGEGLGPAEVDPIQFYTSLLQQYGVSQATASADATQAAGYLMQGTALNGPISGQQYDGRYGDPNTTTSPGPQAGVPGSATALGLVMRFQWADNLIPASYRRNDAEIYIIRQPRGFMGPDGGRLGFSWPAAVLEARLERRSEKRSVRYESLRGGLVSGVR